MLNSSDIIWQKIKSGVFIIAEGGKNFIKTKEECLAKEYLENATELVDAAVLAGADAIKWQMHDVVDEQLNLDIISPHFKGSARYSWLLRNASIPIEEFWIPLKLYCDKKGILFFVTPMSRGAAKKVEQIGEVKLWKVGSGDVLDFVMLDYLRQQDKPIIISSGMSTTEEIKTSLNFLKEKNEKIALMHCVSKYPCPVADLSLGLIDEYKNKYLMPVGFSDHSIDGVEQDLLAVALGATIVEKHFSLSRDFWGADHRFSLLPDEFKTMVNEIRKLENNFSEKEKILHSDFARIALMSKGKKLKDEELSLRPVFYKSLMFACDLDAGSILESNMIYAMRPQREAGGLPSEEYVKVLGKKINKNIKKFDPITWDILS